MVYLFWTSIFCVWYAYVGYLLLLWLFSLVSKEKYQNIVNNLSIYRPKVTLLISAYNEEEIIEKKILNSLELIYPKELFEIIVISDGSDDKTNQIVQKYNNNGIILKQYEGRIGKTACINNTVPSATGEVIIFSDANSLYDKDVITNLVKHFSSENIGFVTGHTKYSLTYDSEDLKPIGLYSNIERITKKLESNIGSCVGADGAIFAIRNNLFEKLNDYDINDFVLPMIVVKKGFRGIFEENAYCIENSAKDTRGEYRRQTRITNRTIRAIFNYSEMLNPKKYGIFAFELLSHKLFKYLVPFFLIMIFISNVIIVNSHYIYTMTFFVQLIFYISAFIKYPANKFKSISKLNSLSRTFVIVNLAILSGWLYYFNGKTYTVWSTNR